MSEGLVLSIKWRAYLNGRRGCKQQKKRLNFKYFASKTTGQGFQAFSFSFSLKIFSLG